MQNIAFASVGAKGMFTREIEDALLAETHRSGSPQPERFAHGAGRAVYAGGDSPTGGSLATCWSRSGTAVFDALPAGAVVGTSSLRRQAQLRARRPDLEYIEFRGNVDTRLAKLAQGKADAIILAAAGLERLQKTAAIRERFAPEVLCPAPGPGRVGHRVQGRG